MSEILKHPFYANKLINEIYSNSDNFIVTKTKSNQKRAIIFFSGNGLYSPNTIDVFEDKVINNNYYEWKNISKSKHIQNYYSLIIYVRDINKCWYIAGINKELNTPDKIIKKLEDLTKGYEITTCGNSAGGYMATLAGIKLNAKRIFNFSGQYKLDENINKTFITSYNKAVEDLTLLFLNDKPDNLYYFCPFEIEQDRLQYSFIEPFNIKTFNFTSLVHGLTVEGRCYPFLLTMSNENLDQLFKRHDKKLIERILFSQEVIPIRYNFHKLLFNVENSGDKKFKILTIFGLNFFIKNKNKNI